jgi:hypothetical protein
MMMNRMESSSCQAMCTGQQLCNSRMDCPMGERCIMAGGFGVCSGGIRDAGGGG